jgi:quercetin dioxygenase-like cupin family protein
MTERRLTMAVIVAIALVAGVWGAQSAVAQPKAPAAAPPGFKRTELSRHDLWTPNHEAVTARADFEPGGAAPRHTHPGDEVGYVLDGQLVLEIEGKPPQNLKAGDTFFVPLGTVHSAKNPGKAPAAVLSTYLVEKGKPLATPVK